jgi:hypothetical protein
MRRMVEHEPYRRTYKVHLAGGQLRLQEMILFVSKKCQDGPYWGKTKLNKILWRADFTAFHERGVPVTGRAYQRIQYGPAPVEMAPLLGEMLNRGLIRIECIPTRGGILEQRIYCESEPNLTYFSRDDISYIDASIEYYWDKTATETSDDSHGVAWKTRADGDAMPYELAYLSDGEIPQELLKKIKGIGIERGWHSE